MKKTLIVILFLNSLIVNSQNDIDVKVFAFNKDKKIDFTNDNNLDKVKSIKLDTAIYGGYPIRYLPKGIEKLYNLERIEFSLKGGTNINEVFNTLTKFKKLTHLDISGNNFNMKGMFEPDEYDCIVQIPETINEFDNLVSLTLSGNLISKLPIQKGKLQKLRTIYLFRNKFTEFPSELFYLPNIQEIGLENNYIKKIPKNICELNKLKTLYVGRNSLKKIPNCLLKKEGLKELGLNENFFSDNKIQDYVKIFKEEKILPWISVKNQYPLSEYPKHDYTGEIIDKLIELYKYNSN
ncbi:leucine-rich repeat domain-containing protein [Flavobacteriaceae bacterium]|nr:leucine-rich repeat domain-containing protein [Flavobacteriaceae bacterium]